MTNNSGNVFYICMSIIQMRLQKTLFLVAFFTLASVLAYSTDGRKLAFVANKKQWHKNVLFSSSFSNGKIFLEQNKITYLFYDVDDLDRIHKITHQPIEKQKQINKGELLVNCHAYKVEFVNANQHPVISGIDKRKEYHNYFIGNDPSKWAGKVPLYNQAIYENIYDGIDLKCYSQNENFKYDFIVNKGADVSLVKLKFEGAQMLFIKNGNLVISTSVGDIIEQKPLAFQHVGDHQYEVACEYVLNENEVSFRFPNGYNKNFPLIIDPVVIASTYSGATNDIYGHTATYDDAGNIYTGGNSFGTGYPITTGAFQATFAGGQDMGISKKNPDGSVLIYSTYVGGGNADYPHSLFVDANSRLHILGTSNSGNYPVSANAYDTAQGTGATSSFDPDLVVTVLDSAGSNLIGSTYIGGSVNDGQNNLTVNYGDSYRGEIICDASGNNYVASYSQSTDFPVTTGALQATNAGMQDGVVFKLSMGCSQLLWSTYIGGTSDDAAYGLYLDAGGDVYVSGSASSGFPTTPGTAYPAYLGGTNDGFLAHISNNGTVLNTSTFFGSTGQDQNFFVELDKYGDVYVMGQTDGSVTATSGTYNGGTGSYFAKFSTDLTTHFWTSTFNSLAPTAFLVDNCDNIYAAGHGGLSALTGFGVTADAVQPASAGFYTIVLSKDAATLKYGSYYGNSSAHVDGGTSRFDKRGIIYEAVCSNAGFPTTSNAYATTSQGAGWDVCIFKIDFQASGVLAVAAASPAATGCAPLTVTFQNTSSGAQDYIWDFGDGTPIDTNAQPTHVFDTVGIYDVMLIAIDSASCNIADTVYTQIIVNDANSIQAGFTTNTNVSCNTFTLLATDTSVGFNLVYQWDMGDGTTYTTQNVTHNYADSGTYIVTLIVTEPMCSGTDTIITSVYINYGAPPIDAGFTVNTSTSCNALDVAVTDTSIGSDLVYAWDMGDGSTYTTQNAAHSYADSGTYSVTLIITDTACNQTDTVVQLVIVAYGVPPVFAGFTVNTNTSCSALDVALTDTSIGSNLVYVWEMGDGTTYNTQNVNHTYADSGDYTVILIITDTACNQTDTTVQILSITYGVPTVDALFTVTQIDPCGLEVQANNTSSGSNLVYQWIIEGTIYTTQNISHTFADSGTYNIILIATDTLCGVADTETVSVTVNLGLTVDIGPDPYLCPDSTATLDAGAGFGAYQWNTGETTQTIEVSSPLAYWVTVTSGNCSAQDTLIINPVAPLDDISYTVEICQGLPAYLSVKEQNVQCLWETGDSVCSITVYEGDEYLVDMTDSYGCVTRDTVFVDLSESSLSVWVPNVFTPNNDGMNDEFSPVGLGIDNYEIWIYNRWGDQIFTTAEFKHPWDGTLGGASKVVPEGVYIYKVTYSQECSDNKPVTKVGHVTVLR